MKISTVANSFNYFRPRVATVAVAAILCGLPQVGLAAPLGGTVASGSATISASGPVTTIDQSSDRAVIDWSSFNLGSDETARFVVPSDQSATLNRISGGQSTISGSVESNGAVYFSNPNGLVFDATSRVSANGFFATSGNISNRDFMSRGEFANHSSGQVTLNGAVSAPAITGLAGTVTVNGSLSAGSGKILLSSTNLTTIGQGATISADGGLSSSGGMIKVWSDNHTDFLGTITAKGGTNLGDGGFVEVSGKSTLNFSGTVSTLAPHGRTGTLLLDPATIEIVAVNGSNPTVSYVTVADLAAALTSNNVTIDAVTPDFGSVAHTNGSGSDGRITVTDPLSWSGTGNLTLSAGAGGIVINAAITSTNATKANLNLVSDGSIRAETAVLTVGTLTASTSTGSILLTGANGISSLGNLSAQLGDVTVRNAIALSVPNTVTEVSQPVYNAGGQYAGFRFVQTSGSVAWQAARGVNLRLDNTNLTPAGNFNVKANYFRLDLGTGALMGNRNINALNLDVYFTGAASGQSGTIAIAAGSFTWVYDKRSSTGATVIDNNTTAALGWGTIGTSFTGTASSGGEYSLAGMRVTSNIFSSSNELRFGVVYGGTVEVRDIRIADPSVSGSVASPASALNYIEAPGIKVTNASSFTGSLTLVSTGAGVSSLGVTAGIVVGGDLTVGTANDHRSDLILRQIGTSGGQGIAIFSSTVSAGGDLLFEQRGQVAAGAAGIFLNAGGAAAAERVSLVAGSHDMIALSTHNQSLSLNGTDDFVLSAELVRFNLGAGAIINGEAAIGESIPDLGFGLNLSGAMVTLVGNSVASRARLLVGSGSFTYLSNRLSLADVTLTNSTTTADLGLTNLSFGGTVGSRSLGGLTILGSRDSALRGIGVAFGGTVKINGVTSGAVAGLNAIEGSGIAVLGSSSHFTGSLTLIGSGWGIAANETYVSVVVINAPLTIGTANDRTSDLNLIQIGNTINYGIMVADTYPLTIAVTVGGNLNLNQYHAIVNKGLFVKRATVQVGGSAILNNRGLSYYEGIYFELANLTAAGYVTVNQTAKVAQSTVSISGSSLTAGLDLSILQSGTFAAKSYGIQLDLNDTSNVRTALAAGNNRLVTLKTNDLPLSLLGNGEVTVSGGRLRIDLGTGSGALRSTRQGVGSQLKLNATGMDVFFTSGLTLLNGTGSSRDNDGTIILGSGKFTFVNDKRSVTSAKTLDNSSTSSDWGTGIGSFWSSIVSLIGIADGLTLETTATTEAAVKEQCDNQGVVYGGAVTIDGLSLTSPARTLTYIEGKGVTISGSASTFSSSSGLMLVSRDTAAVSLGANLTTGGKIWVQAPAVTLTADVTATGGSLVLNLGSGAVNNGSGAGFSLTTSNNSLYLTAGSITNLGATNAIFKLGTGALTTAGAVVVASSVTNSDPIFTGGHILNDADVTRLADTTVAYYFTSDPASKVANDPNGLWFDASAMTAVKLGTKSIGTSNVHYNSAGLSKATGDVFWREAGASDYAQGTATVTDLVLQTGHAVHFVKLNNPTMPSTMPGWLSDSSSLTFDGANQFNTDLILESAGAITQSAGSSLTISKTVVGQVTTDHELQITGSASVTLDSETNSISSLGAISSNGSILITNGSNLSLNGDLHAGTTPNAGNRVELILKNRYELSLKRTISSYGTVRLLLDKGSYTAAGFYWDTNGRSLTLEAGSISGSGKVFAVGAGGRFYNNINFSTGFAKQQLYITNDSEADRQAIQALDADAEIHTLGDLNGGMDKGSFTTDGTLLSDGTSFYRTGNISVTSLGKSYADKDANLIFWNIRGDSVNVSTTADPNRVLFEGTVRFEGAQNSFTSFRFAMADRAKVIVGKNSILNGDITIGTTGIDFEPGAFVKSGTIRSAAGEDLKLNFGADLVQMSNDAAFSAGRTLIVKTNGNSVRLMNRGNSFTNLEVTTDGGNFQLASSQDLTITSLSTSGGWVVLDTTRSITASGVSVGSVSFRAGGSVSLTGAFAAASGSGASIVLNNSAAGSVMGGLRSDSSVTLAGSGSSLLVGDIIGGSAVTVNAAVVVARDLTVAVSGGRIEFARAVAALNSVAGLRLDAGYGGVIALGGNMGAPEVSLGWIELNGLVSNPSGFGAFYRGGSSIPPSERLNSWRTGQ